MQNKRNIDFNISEIVTKNILIYGIFNKKNQNYEAKKYGYKYIN